jgi:hypothetical protein
VITIIAFPKDIQTDVDFGIGEKKHGCGFKLQLQNLTIIPHIGFLFSPVFYQQKSGS